MHVGKGPGYLLIDRKQSLLSGSDSRRGDTADGTAAGGAVPFTQNCFLLMS